MSNYFADYSYFIELQDIANTMKYSEKHPPLDAATELTYLHEYYTIKNSKNISTTNAKRLKQLKDIFVSCNLRMIIKTAKTPQYMGKGLPLKELINEGVLGLIYFLDKKYDIETKNRLMTGGVWWIRQAMGRAIEKKARVVKLPLHIQDKINKVRTVYRQYMAKNNGETPSDVEISILIKEKYDEDISPEEVKTIGRDQYDHCSLDTSIDEGQSSLVDFITVNGSEDLQDEAELNWNKNFVHNKLLPQLTKQEQKFIIFKFGLIDHNDKRSKLNMSEILGMSLKDYNYFEKQTMQKVRDLCSIDEVCW